MVAQYKYYLVIKVYIIKLLGNFIINIFYIIIMNSVGISLGNVCYSAEWAVQKKFRKRKFGTNEKK